MLLLQGRTFKSSELESPVLHFLETRELEHRGLSRRLLSLQELAAEKAKAVASESKLKEQLVAREREITAVQARMQASYQDHVSETQQLQGKVGSGAS